jgi:hypothetical protein
MLRKIVSIVALLCFLGVSNHAMAYNWSPNTTWHGDVDANWFNPLNWWVSDTDPNKVPDIDYQALIEPKGQYPTIDGDATCGFLNIMPWSWPGVGDFSVDMNSGTFDVNFGISIGAWGDYDSAGGSGTPVFTVNNGTVTVLTTPGDGILVGGGSDGYAATQGKLYMYGGTVQSDRIELRHGQIHLNGGTLDCNSATGFKVYQNSPANKIDISGGTLKVRGDWTGSLNEPCLPGLIRNGRIYSARGVIGTPVFDGNFTTVTSTDNNMAQAWNPSPANNATNVHYRVADVNVGVMLSWDTGEPNVLAHHVFFGTNSNIVNSVIGDANEKAIRVVANGDPCTWGLDDVNWPAGFKLNTNYYWRVDEEWRVSDDLDVNAVTKGRVWVFKTNDGRAYNNIPVNGGGLSEPLALRWTAGDLAASHLVYVGTDASSVLNANSTTAQVYRGIQTGTSYSLANLKTNWYGPLMPGVTYYWKITEINNTTQWNTGLSGIVWNFTPVAYVTVDDFEDYNSTADMNANWATQYDNCTYIAPYGNAEVALVQGGTSHGKYMQFTYHNAKDTEARYFTFSETKRSYNPGTTFTGGGELLPAPAALSIDVLGSAINGADPTYDRMYVALQDTAGNIAIYLNPDAAAQQNTIWKAWLVGLKDINSLGTPAVVKLENVSAFMLGLGVRCNYDPAGGDGNVMFDNIRLYAQTCNPDFAYSHGLLADLNGDCTVDINDLDLFADAWLYAAENRTFPTITQPAAPVLWYKFNDTSLVGSVIDYGTTGTYTGTVHRFSKLTWNPTGSRTGGPCLNLPDIPPHPTSTQSYVAAPVAAADGNGFMGNVAHNVANGGGGVSFSIWINATFPGDFYSQWGSIFSIQTSAGFEYIEIPLPSRIGPGFSGALASMNFAKHIHTLPTTTSASAGMGNMPLLDFGGRWNHWAFVKTASNINGPYGSLKVYMNGTLLVSCDANGQTGDPNAAATGPLWDVVTDGVGAFRIGTRGDNWAMWAGKLNDFQMYDYALSDAEIAWLASDGTGSLLLKLLTPANMVTPGPVQNQVVNFADLAEMCTEWRTTILWP